MGLLFYIFSTNSSDFYKMFFVVGFLGSFTTFSAFSLDAMNLFLASQYINFLIYIILSVVLSILFIFLVFVRANDLIILSIRFTEITLEQLTIKLFEILASRNF